MYFGFLGSRVKIIEFCQPSSLRSFLLPIDCAAAEAACFGACSQVLANLKERSVPIPLKRLDLIFKISLLEKLSIDLSKTLI
jgi:hypothetical protein